MMAAAVSAGIGATIIVLIMAKVQRATAVASPGEVRSHVDPPIFVLCSKRITSS